MTWDILSVELKFEYGSPFALKASKFYTSVL